MSKNQTNNIINRFVEKFHSLLVFSRRTEVLSSLVSSILPSDSTVLDIGCGDGTIDKKILGLKPGLNITGIDVLKRKQTYIPVIIFDGKNIPTKDNEFDSVLILDTLHHTSNPTGLIKEAKRVTKKYIIIKDHFSYGKLSYYILRFMDWIGNEAHNVNLPYNYLTPGQWDKIYKDFGLKKEVIITKLNLYPFPFNLLFERNYHFIIKLSK